ncbi:2-dehydro-3-deoxygalactonokinase [Octadecabacter temperatus]|uniref:2-keto-3-deoxy-galactonokinase n=1 Tax=Octadecabacter temperatus TaxID=1458307 RepID=A0A0K0Y8W7_9RHOB|nr:2-dehydro-3-deoxygalactonokinase [Octadecabacter temperatus]AKS47331.1 2-keto-3-deoxy-galactonokinase [Octadecabacter temperatus]SIO43892.1 2-dehydro-3-deoxygalactonokinase [Octadecabacter temperatus]
MTSDHMPKWIAADWGTSNLRLWAIGDDGAVLDMRTSDKGMGQLAPDAFEAVLVDLAADWLDTADTVVACGMVGSRQGWVEAPYQTAPCGVCPNKMVTAPVLRDALTVHVIPGIRQTDPADVMRGEETQIAGYLAQTDDWDGVICLPGTHTKWVHVSAGEVVSFQTCMTGEMFALLAEQSVLRHSIADSGWDEDTFLEAVSQTMSRPERLAGQLFSLRAAQLVHDTDAQTLRARLSGLLIGAELASTKPYWLGQNVALIGADAVSQPYLAGLAAQGVDVARADATEMTLAGIKAAHALLETK